MVGSLLSLETNQICVLTYLKGSQISWKLGKPAAGEFLI